MTTSILAKRKFAAGCLMLATIFFVVSSVMGAEPQPRILITSPNHDLGSVFEAEKYSHIFLVKNTGEAELKIERVKPG